MVYTEEYHIRKRKGNTYLLMPDPVSDVSPPATPILRDLILLLFGPVLYKFFKTDFSGMGVVLSQKKINFLLDFFLVL
jgi:hypothetical protein